jgi:hypothetical protein
LIFTLPGVFPLAAKADVGIMVNITASASTRTIPLFMPIPIPFRSLRGCSFSDQMHIGAAHFLAHCSAHGARLMPAIPQQLGAQARSL